MEGILGKHGQVWRGIMLSQTSILNLVVIIYVSGRTQYTVHKVMQYTVHRIMHGRLPTMYRGVEYHTKKKKLTNEKFKKKISSIILCIFEDLRAL